MGVVLMIMPPRRLGTAPDMPTPDNLLKSITHVEDLAATSIKETAARRDVFSGNTNRQWAVS
jgi:hypothetical protein